MNSSWPTGVVTQRKLTIQQVTAPLAFNRQSSNYCLNFKASGVVIPLDCACIPAPLNCPPGLPNFCNFGARIFPVTIGDYEGEMTSVITSLEQKGNPDKRNAAFQLTLIHYFISNIVVYCPSDDSLQSISVTKVSACLLHYFRRSWLIAPPDDGLQPKYAEPGYPKRKHVMLLSFNQKR